MGDLGSVVEAFRGAIDGTVSVPGEPGYDTAVSIWNGVIERRPALVVSCVSSGDVVAALAAAKEQGLEVSVRGGGHNAAGFALCEGGLMIDLTPMKSVVVDASARRVVCGGGTTWGELDAATQEHGLAVPGGLISTTGVAGLSLGGGFGWLSRLAGLTSDNLLAAEVVTADGRVLRASSAENEDLFWALRGGGGNFGVVTSFEFGLTPVGPLVHLALFMYSPEQGGDVFRFAREYVKGLPDECGVLLAGMSAPPEAFVPEEHHLAPVYAILIVGLGDAEAHAGLIGPVHEALPPLIELVTPIPYTALQQMFNASAPWGILAYEKAVYLEELSDAAIDVILDHQPKKAFPLSFLPIVVLGGTYGRADDDVTAFGGSRSVGYVVNIAAAASTRELYEAERAWARTFWSALMPHAVGVGGYVNFMSEYEEDRVRAAYGPQKYERLAAVKAKYDPDNRFHLNANILPQRPTLDRSCGPQEPAETRLGSGCRRRDTRKASMSRRRSGAPSNPLGMDQTATADFQG
ncbi:MAG: FAD-binding oxidoreductase [Solirubrobacteraceae bacterium]